MIFTHIFQPHSSSFQSLKYDEKEKTSSKIFLDFENDWNFRTRFRISQQPNRYAIF